MLTARFTPFAGRSASRTTTSAALAALALFLPVPASADPVLEGLRPAVHVEGMPEERWALAERMKAYGVSAVGIAVIRDGEIVSAEGYGLLQAGRPEKANADTMFSVGSLSKVGAAAIILRMVDAGLLDLDRDVNSYLKRWHIPPGAWSADNPVTLRRLLSHTAGANVRGYPDFQPGARLPTLLDSLDGKPPAVTEPVRILSAPGARSNYSGGGVTIEQLVVEDVLGIDFETAARRYLFEPLGMRNSTYAQPLPARFRNAAKAHDASGNPVALPRGYEAMPETAASGLWTTAGDYARLAAALIRSYRGEPRAFLSQPLAAQMMTEISPGPVGLGPFLSGSGYTRRFYHTGANDSYKAWMEGNLATGDGLVVLTNGANGSRLYPEIRRAVAATSDWQTDRVVEVPAAALAQGWLATLAGRYRFGAPRGIVEARMGVFPMTDEIVVRLLDGRLTIAGSKGENPDVLIPADRTNFLQSSDNMRSVEFVTGEAGKVEGLILRNGTSAWEAKRVDPQH